MALKSTKAALAQAMATAEAAEPIAPKTPKRVTDFAQAASYEGLVALGVDTVNNLSVQVPLQFVKDGADAANQAAARANEVAQNITDDVSALVPYVGENLIFGSSQPISGYTVGGLKSLDLSIGFLKKGATYVAHWDLDEFNGAIAEMRIITRNGPTIFKVIEKGVPFIADRDDWEYFLVHKNNTEGWIRASNIKLEVGSKATPYIPNPADIARSIDCSLLTEQEVPGKLFTGSDGVPRQVYCRTISAQGIFAPHGNNQAIFAVNTPLINIDSIIGVEGFTAVADGQGVNKSLVITNTDFVLFTYDAGGGYYQANRVKAVCIIDAAYIGQSITLFSNIQYLKL